MATKSQYKYIWDFDSAQARAVS